MVDTTVTLMPPRDLLYFVTTTQTKPFVRNRSHCLLSNAHKDCTTKHKGPLSDAFDLRFNVVQRAWQRSTGADEYIRPSSDPARKCPIAYYLAIWQCNKSFSIFLCSPSNREVSHCRTIPHSWQLYHGDGGSVQSVFKSDLPPSATEPGGRKSDVHLLIKDPTHPSKPVSNLSDFHFFRSNR